MQYVNIGCGQNYHPAWINIDIAPVAPEVTRHDVSAGIPLASSSCDVVYHSHVLEHLRREDALPFLRECRRVLKPGGVLRVATPDLEAICRVYLQKLDGAIAGNAGSADDYDWIILELLDQLVRERRGGAMAEYLRRTPLRNESFVLDRVGEEARRIMRAHSAREPIARRRRRGLTGRLSRRLGRATRGLRARIALGLLGNDAGRALEIGRFRLAGEVHQWLYDRHSLCGLLASAGFVDAAVETAASSRIADWRTFALDTLPDGTTRKPDSLFMEAIVPDAATRGAWTTESVPGDSGYASAHVV